MAQVEFLFNDFKSKEKEKGSITLDPTNRFERSNDIISFHPRLILYKAYDRQTGLEVTWHELLCDNISSDRIDFIAQKADRIKQLHYKTINSIVYNWFSESKRKLFYITQSLSTSTIYSNILNSNLEIKPQVIARWFYPVLQSLQYLHSINPPILHGKIHPENIFVKASSGSIKICSPSLKSNVNNSEKKSIVLSPTIPPEFLLNHEDTCSDIYSFGMSVLFTITRVEPYEECKSPAELVYKLSNYIPPNSLSLVTDQSLHDLIENCLKPPNQRPSATELLNHRFFNIRFINANLSPQSLNSEELIVIFTGKSRSDTDLQSADSDDLIQLDSNRSYSTTLLTKNPEYA